MKKLLALYMLALMGIAGPACVASTEPVDEPSQAPKVEPQSTCPVEWTCDFLKYYTAKIQCQAACGSDPCVLDNYCHAGCFCP